MKIEEGQFRTIGFEIFDFTHIIVAILTIIVGFVRKGDDPLRNLALSLEITSEFISLCLAIILIFFVKFIVDNHDPKMEKILYSFAWIIANFALLSPCIFRGVDLIMSGGETALDTTLAILDAIFPTISAALFTTSLYLLRKEKDKWYYTMLAGMIAFILSALTSSINHAVEIFEWDGNGRIWDTGVECVTALVALVPAIIGILDILRIRKEDLKKPE